MPGEYGVKTSGECAAFVRPNELLIKIGINPIHFRIIYNLASYRKRFKDQELKNASELPAATKTM